MTESKAAKSASERRRDRRFEEIAEVARKLFATRGFAETSLAEIASAVDLSPKAIYYYYPSKRAILDSILERGFVYFEAAQLAAARTQWEGLSLRDALIESGLASVNEIVTHADLLRLSFAETFRGNAMTHARHEKYMRNWAEHMEVLLGERAAERSISPEQRRPLAEAITEALFGLSVDSVLRGRDHAWSTSDGAVSERKRYIATLVDALLEGVGSGD
jgi:AcrR family transcriptional regulator